MISNLVKQLKIGDVTLKNNLILAPMAGYGDIAFRTLCREFGAGLTVTEMISVKGLFFENEKTEEMLRLGDNEKPSCVQLFGSDPKYFELAVKNEKLAKFDIIDINMGCPVKKVTKNGEGSALIKNISLAKEIVAAANSGGKPVTVKFRIGWDSKSINAVNFAVAMEEAGAKAISAHGRTTEQLYGGKADWETIGLVKQAVNIPVIGNGDISSAPEGLRRLGGDCCLFTGEKNNLQERDVADDSEKNNLQELDNGENNCGNNAKKKACVDGIMIGRGALGHPDIFAELLGIKGEFTESGNSLLNIILKHIQLMEEYFPTRYVVVNMRKHLACYLKGVPNTKEIKTDINYIDDINELKERLKRVLL